MERRTEMKKIIELPHRAFDFNCMISGLEDMLAAKTGIWLPPYLACFGGFLGFYYESNPNAAIPKRVMQGWGIGKGQYQFLSEVYGFRWEAHEGARFEEAWESMRGYIDRGFPLILGELDMFHLPYYKKFYHRIHVPIHYITLVGYDAEMERAYLLDNGHAETQCMALRELRRALNIPAGGDSQPNTYYSFDLANVPSQLQRGAIIQSILRNLGRRFLHPPVETQGIRAMQRLAREFPQWSRELTPRRWHASLRNMVTFTSSTVPMLPQRLVPFPLEPHLRVHHGMRDRFADLLDEIAQKEGLPDCRNAAAAFRESGLLFQEMTDAITEFLAAWFKTARVAQPLDRVPPILSRIAEIETSAFGILEALPE
jgi:hypothetical protein